MDTVHQDKQAEAMQDKQTEATLDSLLKGM